VKQPNPHARALRDPRFRPRVVKPRKGRGSYTRKPRSAQRASGAFHVAATLQQRASDSTPRIPPSASRRVSCA